MNQNCTNLQLRLMDSTADSKLRLSPGEQAHLQGCAECRDVLETCVGAAAALECLGGTARQNTQSQAAETEALKTRVLQHARRQWTSAHALAASPAGESARNALVQLFQSRLLIRWGMAAACCVLLLAGV